MLVIDVRLVRLLLVMKLWLVGRSRRGDRHGEHLDHGRLQVLLVRLVVCRVDPGGGRHVGYGRCGPGIDGFHQAEAGPAAGGQRPGCGWRRAGGRAKRMLCEEAV